ncbi:MAG: radical SAM family heme chaperone HemW [Gammaproteobacteria bacterium]|nr:radical SAM family heme chaperone HemW [Gammaproteobacteria bacterium]
MLLSFSASPPLSLYIHFPWCVRKCPYCDFNSHEPHGAIPEQRYIDALLADLQQQLPAVWGRPLESVFIGGGTPSLLSPEAIERLLSALRAMLGLGPDIEVTLEANPGTLEQGRFAEYRAAGINRLSIGVQSFDEEKLRRLGRIHSRREALRAAEAAHAAGLENFNLDLMFGLPGQSPAQARADVAQAITLEPAHISWYQLTIEPNTAFAHAPPVVPEDDALWAIQQLGQETLAAAGYVQYEVSAYAREGRRCRHNLNYWQFGDYLGIGPGAHGKLTDAPQGRVERQWKQRHPQAWLESAAGADVVAGRRTLGREDLVLEFMMNALRLREGFASALFQAHTGMPISTVEPALREAERKGLLQWQLQRVLPTERGHNYLNELLQLFMPEEK